MPARLLPLCALLPLLLLAGCAPSGDGDGDIWSGDPVPVGEWMATVSTAEVTTGWEELAFRLEDADGAPVQGLSIVSDVFMPTHGHGSSEPVTTAADPDEPGVYVVSAFLTMPGEWEVTSDLDPEGADETLVFLVEAVAE